MLCLTNQGEVDASRGEAEVYGIWFLRVKF